MIDAPVELPDGPPIPGLRARMFDPGRDYEPLVALITAANRADGVEYVPSADGLRNDHVHGGEYDPRRDLVLVEVDGQLVGAAETSVRTRDGIGVHHVEGWVHPAWRRRGLGRALLALDRARAAEVARVDGRARERALSSWPDESQVGATTLYARAGYEIVRYGFLMVRDLADADPGGGSSRPASSCVRSSRPITAGSGMPTPRRSGTTGAPASGPRPTSGVVRRSGARHLACGGSPGTATRSRAP